ncbi:MAG: peptidylprolyl isomerase [Pyrinomonadaceae bacterium]
MNRILLAIFLLSAALTTFAQNGRSIEIRILKAEDARRFDGALGELFKNESSGVRRRAALAAGRIGDDRAVEQLAALLSDDAVEVREIAAFAIGEIESLKAADAVLKGLKDASVPDAVRARLVEAAGKIAAANAGPPNTERDPKAAALGEAILDVLEAEEGRREKQHRETIRLALTAALRVRPEGADTVAALFLTNMDARIRSDAANTLSRLRAKTANPALRSMLMSDDDPIARANAARALGSAGDKGSVNMLIVAAVEDEDARVRVSAIRSLAVLHDPFAIDRLLEHGEALLASAWPSGRGAKSSRKRAGTMNPAQKSELLEIATAVGRLVPKTNDGRTLRFLTALSEADHHRSPETEIAFARVAPKRYSEYLRSKKDEIKASVGAVNATVQGIAEFAKLGTTDEEIELKTQAAEELGKGLRAYSSGEKSAPDPLSVPELLRAYAAFKPDGLDAELRRHLLDKNVFIRVAAASLLAERTANKENFDALISAFPRALITDKNENDAQIAILDAMYKVDKKGSVGMLLIALNAPDYLVRKKAFELLGDPELRKEFPAIETSVAEARMDNHDQVRPYSAGSGTKLGQVLNTDADYRRAVSRKNGSVRAVLKTRKGTFTIDLLPDDAPLTVDNFIKLARSRYFDGLEVHRVVPNFVMQDGDPRGDGNGGPGWSIRCEINMVSYERGAVGMALSGKDTGGSQWFVTHSPQPHLDGGYTVFGKVNESGMKVVDKIVRGDKILTVRIVEGSPARRRRK